MLRNHPSEGKWRSSPHQCGRFGVDPMQTRQRSKRLPQSEGEFLATCFPSDFDEVSGQKSAPLMRDALAGKASPNALAQGFAQARSRWADQRLVMPFQSM
jgi:hypothetical protein